MSKYSANGFQGNTVVQHQRGGTMAKAVWGHMDIEALADACEPSTHRIWVSWTFAIQGDEKVSLKATQCPTAFDLTKQV